jgi:hypothetical protein
MPNLLIKIDDETAKHLKRAAPRGQRARFVRLAIAKALMHHDEMTITRPAYEKWPQEIEDPDPWFDARTWDPESWEDAPPKKRRAPRKKR